MILLSQERVEAYWETLDKLVKEHVVPEHKDDGPPIDMDWPMYMRVQASRALILVCARKGGHIVGFAMYYVMPHPHHKTLLCGHCDSLVTRVEDRGKGIGTKLIKFGEHVLRSRGVQYVLHNQKVPDGIEPLCAKLGYKLEEQSYRKAL
jgi:GNAT superfamily N-acetyltransferase